MRDWTRGTALQRRGPDLQAASSCCFLRPDARCGAPAGLAHRALSETHLSLCSPALPTRRAPLRRPHAMYMHSYAMGCTDARAVLMGPICKERVREIDLDGT